MKLISINDENSHLLLPLGVSEEQSIYVSSSEKCIRSWKQAKESSHLFGLEENDNLVGVILCQEQEKSNFFFVWQFFIDFDQQGKGYGKEALRKTIEWMMVYRPSFDIVTTVIEGNKEAENFYESLGFRRMSDTYDGETDYKLDISSFTNI